MYQRQHRDPRTKEEVLDRVLSYDFNGDIRDIGAETARIVRTGPNKMLLHFPVSGRTYELTVRLPRNEQTARPPQVAQEPRSFAPAENSVPQAEARKTRPSKRVQARTQRRAARRSTTEQRPQV